MISPGEIDATISEQSSPTPKSNIQSVNSGKEPSADEELVINEENAKVYVPLYLRGLTDLGHQQGQLRVTAISQTSNVGQPWTTKVSEDPKEASKHMEVSFAKSIMPSSHRPRGSSQAAAQTRLICQSRTRQCTNRFQEITRRSHTQKQTNSWHTSMLQWTRPQPNRGILLVLRGVL